MDIAVFISIIVLVLYFLGGWLLGQEREEKAIE